MNLQSKFTAVYLFLPALAIFCTCGNSVDFQYMIGGCFKVRIDDETRNKIILTYQSGNYSYSDLAKMFGVSSTSIGRIVNPDYQKRERENSKIRQRNYTPQKALYSVNLRFNDNEEHLVDKLRSVYNIQQYIKGLIASDIEKKSH